MKFLNNREKESEELVKKYKEKVWSNYTKVKSCCECQIYIEIVQTLEYKYRIVSHIKNTCFLHQQEALDKYSQNVKSKLL